MQQSDGEILQRPNGQLAFLFSNILRQGRGSWDTLLPLEEILINRDLAKQQIQSILPQYWCELNKSYAPYLKTKYLDLHFANERIASFYQEADFPEAVMQHMQIHKQLTLPSLLSVIFKKSFDDFPLQDEELAAIYFHQIKGSIFLHPVFEEQEAIWHEQLAQRVYSIFMQQPLEQIDEPVKLMAAMKDALAGSYTKNRVITIIHQVIQQLKLNNNPSYELKQLDILDVLYHFTSGRRHFKKLRKCIMQVQYDWQSGQYALSEKETTLLAYILMSEAYARRNYKETVHYGYELFENERLNNHAVEFLVEYNHFLKTRYIQADSLIKDFTENYLEHVFYMMVNALVRLQMYEQAVAILTTYEAASTTVVYRLLNFRTRLREDYEALDQMMQESIRHLIVLELGSDEYYMQIWQYDYLDPRSQYRKIVRQSSTYMCNMLKAFYQVGQLDLFDRLSKVYVQYLLVPSHYNQLLNSIDQKKEI